MPSWKKVIISGSRAELSSLYAPSITGSLQGTASWAINAVTASYATNAADIVLYVKNTTGTQIDKGTVVRITGATGNNALISTASYESDPVSANTLGITRENIANDAFGYVITEGTLLGINTDLWTAGQLLFLGASGSITGSAPLAPLHAVRLGQVLRVQSNNGSMYVRIDNGYELNELHDVDDNTTTASYGDLLVKSGSVWTNSRQLSGSYGLTGSLTIDSNGANGLVMDTDLASSTASSRIFFKNSGSYTDFSIRNTGQLLVIAASASAGVSSGTGRMFISASGEVAIGTGYNVSAGRGAALQVSGSINIEEGFAYKQDGNDILYITRGATGTSYDSIIGGVGAVSGAINPDQTTAYGYYALANSNGTANTAVGYNTGENNTGSNQTLVGWNAGSDANGGSQTAMGRNAGYGNNGTFQAAYGYQAGYQNVGTNQTAIGPNAGYQNTASNQTAVGESAGYRNSGSNQTAIGANAGDRNTATQQSALGLQAGYFNTGVAQTALGQQAGQSNIGTNQTATGYVAGYQNSGSFQTATGANSGRDNKGDLQTATGYEAGRLNIEDNQSAYGYRAGYANTGSNQTAVGSLAGRFNSGSNQTAVGVSAGEQNTANTQTAIGSYAGYFNTGSAQTVVGYEAGYLNTGSNQTAMGLQAGYQNSGSNQVAMGNSAGERNRGNNQTAIGSQAGYLNTGSNQTAVGYASGYQNSGSDNTNIGYQAGTYTTGVTINSQSAQSVFLGSQTTAGGGNRTNQIVIGYNADGIGSNSVVLGNSSIATTALRGNVGIGTTTPTYTLQIHAAPTASIRLQETGSGGNKRLDLTIEASGVARISANQSAQQIAFDTVGSERIRITSTGNVGIGISTPLASLHTTGSAIISGSMVIGSSSLGPSENTLTLGARDAVNEGGQLGFNAPGGTYTSASFIDNWQNKARILKGNNTTSTGLIAQWDIHTTQMQLPGYTAASSFAGTAAGYLAFDSSGNILTVGGVTATPGGSNTQVQYNNGGALAGTPIMTITNPTVQISGSTSITGSLTVTQPIYVPINGGMYFQGGDDAALYDINVSNHMGIYGVQDSTVATIKLGSGGGTISGKSGNIGIGTINPTSASLTVNGNVWATSFTGSLFGTASFAITASHAVTASYVATASYSTIKTSGTTIYSTDPATTNFSTDYGIYIGNEAGTNATNASLSNFIGINAGYGAINASNSNFFGPGAGVNASEASYSNFSGYNAGGGAINASNSNFFGQNAGFNATSAAYSNFFGLEAGYAASASYSNLFGFRAGYTVFGQSIGSNNIIIGTNITLNVNQSNAINIGGIIFGTGSYSNTLTSPYSGSVTDGRIGIGVVAPRATLDVSGSFHVEGTYKAPSGNTIDSNALIQAGLLYLSNNF